MQFNLTTNFGQYIVDSHMRGMVDLKKLYIEECLKKGQPLLSIKFDYSPTVSSPRDILLDVPFSSANVTQLGQAWGQYLLATKGATS